MYRSIGMKRKNPPTILLDEADTVFGPKAGDNEDLRGLLNAGHQRNRPALRYNAANTSVEKIQTFAMAALAGIGAMPDTIEDRAVVIRMRRRAPGESVAPYRTRRDGPALDNLRNRLNQWVRAHLDHLGSAMPDMPVEDRAADTWEPLLAVADLAGGAWPDLARAACLTADRDPRRQRPTQHPGPPARPTAAPHFGTAEMLATTDLLDHLKDDPEAPWATYGNTGLTPVRLGALLRDFDIKSSNLRLGKDEAGTTVRPRATGAPTSPTPGPATARPRSPTRPSRPSRPKATFPQIRACSRVGRLAKSSRPRAVPLTRKPSQPSHIRPSRKTAPDQPKYPAGTAGTAGTPLPRLRRLPRTHGRR